MDLDLEEELNWFAEDPVPNTSTPPINPLPSKPRSSTYKLKSVKSNNQKSKNRGDGDDDDVTNENKQQKSEFTLSAKTPSELLGKLAKTVAEKLCLLEERDKLMRIKYEKEELSAGKPSTKGFCPDMCPEKERILRDVRGIFASYEAYPASNSMDHNRAVKEYTRSSADQDEPLPHELRPTPVLRMTMDYLIVEIMQKLDENEIENKGNWYDFCWGRLRAIRKDIIQQQLCSLNAVAILEECTRFHICCFDRLWGSSNSVFDDKMNSETLMNCLKSLMDMYKDLSKQGKSCPNEAEFYAYMILIKLNSGFVLSEFNSFPVNLQRSSKVREAIEMHAAYSNNMYPTYFKLAKKTTYLNACLLQRFFGHVRTKALEIIVKSHCPPRQHIKLSVSYLAQILKFDKLEDCIAFCADFGLSLNSDHLHFKASRNDFYYPDTMFTESKSSSVVVNKRIPVAQSVLGQNELPKIFKHEIHSSFNDDVLSAGSLDASDQEEKMLRDTVQRSVLTNKKTGETVKCPSPEIVIMETVHDEDVEEHEMHLSDADMTSDMPYVDEESKDSSFHESDGSIESESSDSEETDSRFDVDNVESVVNSDSSFEEELSSPQKPISPIAATPPILEVKASPETHKIFETKKSPSKINILNVDPFVNFKPYKSPEIPLKRPKLAEARISQNVKTEYENSVIMAKLRKKLSEKMKRVVAKKYAQLWKAKVDKMRKSRSISGGSVKHITLSEYIKLWGSARVGSKSKTLDRLRRRNRANLLVVALLNSNIIDRLDSKVREVGYRVAEILGQVSVKYAANFGNVAQPQPVFWKLVVSLPRRISEGKVFLDRLKLWSRTAFEMRIDPEISDVCSYLSSAGVPIFIHFVVIEGIEEIDVNGRNLTSAVVVRAEGWESQDETIGRVKRLISVARCSIPMEILTLGNAMEPLYIEKHDRDKLLSVRQTSWIDTNAFTSTLMRLAQNHSMDNLKLQTLGVVIEISIERFLDTLHQDRYLVDELSDCLCEPNYIIKLYNSFIEKLEKEIVLSSFYNYYGLACELEPLVKKLKYSHDIFPSNYENTETFKSALTLLMKNSFLSPLPWQFSNSIGLMDEFKTYCSNMGCSALLPNIIRFINPPDSDSDRDLMDYLNDVQWLQIVERLAKGRINESAYSFKVVYREDKVRELATSHWWLRSEL